MVPHRLKSNSEALQFIARAGLSRTHRHLFLLVDGARTVAEFAHLLRRSEREVHTILFDLQTIGCIAFLSPDQAKQESQKGM
jgi:predicted transcriptional regulator